MWLTSTDTLLCMLAHLVLPVQSSTQLPHVHIQALRIHQERRLRGARAPQDGRLRAPGHPHRGLLQCDTPRLRWPDPSTPFVRRETQGGVPGLMRSCISCKACLWQRDVVAGQPAQCVCPSRASHNSFLEACSNAQHLADRPSHALYTHCLSTQKYSRVGEVCLAFTICPHLCVARHGVHQELCIVAAADKGGVLIRQVHHAQRAHIMGMRPL